MTIGTTASSSNVCGGGDRQTILIPLDPNMTFTTALRNRTVLEFPTVYVLPFSEQELKRYEDVCDTDGTCGDRYVLEDDYLARTVHCGDENAITDHDSGEGEDEEEETSSVSSVSEPESDLESDPSSDSGSDDSASEDG
jgi:hypothetical protein